MRSKPSAAVSFSPIILESLEERIAPASLPFTDGNGDSVLLTTSKGTVAQLTAAAHFTNAGDLKLLDLKNAAFAGTNVTIKVLSRGPVGDGLANVGLIDATGNDLGMVKVAGDVGKILAGDANDATMGLKSFTAQSVGKYGNVTQGNTGNIDWLIHGGTSKFTVANSVDGALLHWTAAGALKVGSITIGGDLTGIGSVQTGDGSIQLTSTAHNTSIGSLKIGGSLIGDATYGKTGYVAADKVGAVTIGGSLIGSAQANTAELDFTSANPAIKMNIGKVIIGGSVVGGGGANSGEIFASEGIASLKITGGLTGGSGMDSGVLEALTSGNISVGGDIQGGSGQTSGSLLVFLGKNFSIGGSIIGGSNTDAGDVNLGVAANVTVGGDVIGGTANFTGEVLVTQVSGKLYLAGSLIGNAPGVANAHIATGYIQVSSAKTVEIGGDIVGGNNTTASTIHDSGSVVAGFAMQNVIVHGSIRAGSTTNAADRNLGDIRAQQSIGSVQIDGSLIGSATQDVLITGGGNTGIKTGADLAIGKLTVNGNVSGTQILGGYATGGTGVNGNGLQSNGGSAQLGTITIKGDFIDSSIATGVNNHGFAWADAGNHNTQLTKIAGNTIVGSIAKIVIGGAVNAAAANGIIAEQIQSFTVGGFAFPLGNAAIHQAVNFNNKVQIQTFMAP